LVALPYRRKDHEDASNVENLHFAVLVLLLIPSLLEREGILPADDHSSEPLPYVIPAKAGIRE
jgi:hypothetical protein